MNGPERRCIDCHRWLPLELMKRHRKTPDGRQNLCKACDARRFREYRRRNLQAVRERERLHAQRRRARAISEFLQNTIDKRTSP